ncbi:MAG: hypothetical protein V3V78_01980 [Candidatus Woesearchaeota archaeon]
MKRINIKAFILFFLFILSLKPVLGFLSPSTLTLAAASIGSFVWGAVIIVFVNGALFFKKIKRKPRQTIAISSIVILIALAVIVSQRYVILKEFNEVYEDIPLLEYEVDLNTITEEELLEYKLFQIKTTISSTLTIKNAELIEKIDIDLLGDMPNLLNNIDEFGSEHDITKDDKLLFICEGGKSTQVLAILFNNAGYDAYFARLKRLSTDKDMIDTPVKKTNNLSSELIVVPLSWRPRKQDVYFTFDLINPSKFLSEEDEDSLEILPYEEFDLIELDESNIVCSFNLHCILTKYLLDSHGIRERRIYKIPVDAEDYNDMNLYKLPKSVRDKYDSYGELIQDIKK